MRIEKFSKRLNLFLTVLMIVSLSSLADVYGMSSSRYASQTNQPVVNNFSTVNQSKTNINNQVALSSSEISICKTKQLSINQLTSKIINTEQNQLSVVTSVALRIESLYNQKSKPISNYSQLIYQIGLYQTKAYSDFTALQSISTFSCTTNNPKLTLVNFQTSLKNDINDLISLRNSINNLIIAMAKSNNILISTKN